MPSNEEATKELDALALEIFSKRVASQSIRRGIEQVAIDSYRKAEAFLKVQKRVRAGELKVKEADESILADVCAPNRPRTDPYNMVSRQFGSLEAVNRVAQWLNKNPTPESDEMDIVHRFKAAFHELQWGNTEEEVFTSIKVARVMFPNYAVAK